MNILLSIHGTFLKNTAAVKKICAWEIAGPQKFNYIEDGDLKYFTDNGKAPQSWQYTRADFGGLGFFYHKKIDNHGSAIQWMK